jgi:hypothetical protein
MREADDDERKQRELSKRGIDPGSADGRDPQATHFCLREEQPEDEKGRDAGAAYVFGRNQGGSDNWGEVTKLTASDGATPHSFGYSIGFAGGTAIFGALLETERAPLRVLPISSSRETPELAVSATECCQRYRVWFPSEGEPQVAPRGCSTFWLIFWPGTIGCCPSEYLG